MGLDGSPQVGDSNPLLLEGPKHVTENTGCLMLDTEMLASHPRWNRGISQYQRPVARNDPLLLCLSWVFSESLAQRDITDLTLVKMILGDNQHRRIHH
mmetsp:Transcript_9102/g.14809  ORF Transcript_9102/g.14809 Transcript_9102/m.14809 type:complete len:98 (-) Transcript_9102:1587-1880(-)